MAKRQYSIAFEDKTWKAICAKASDLGVTAATVVRWAVERYMETFEGDRNGREEDGSEARTEAQLANEVGPR